MEATAVNRIRVAPLAELKQRGVIVVQGADRPIAVFAHDGEIAAVDNRCPHLGFPLHRGTVQDGILTCHWHHARFDLSSGCTFDLWADDVPHYAVRVEDGVVYVELPRDGARPLPYHFRRLTEGLEQNIGLIQAKATIGLLQCGVEPAEIVARVATFGLKHRDGWGVGLTSLVAAANLIPQVESETAYLALVQGASSVADDCDGQPPRHERRALESSAASAATLKRWFRYWTLVRHRDAAERTLLTAVQNHAAPAELIDMIASAVTDRPYADSGHALDFANKAFELLDLIGWEHAELVLPSLVPRLVASRGGEEQNAWRHPVDLVPEIRRVEARIPQMLRDGHARSAKGQAWNEAGELIRTMLGEDPLAILAALERALEQGARPEQLSAAVAEAAALRIARFGTANELSDWNTVLHTFSYANALDQIVRRSPSADVVRGIFHGAISVYLDRFLNIPPAPLPGERRSLDGEPVEAEVLCRRLLELLDQRHRVEEAAAAVARYLTLGHPLPLLVDALVRSVVREDADFHALQMVEAAVRQYRQHREPEAALPILVALARFLAARFPTQRSQLQMAEVALRLHRGDRLYDEETE